MGNTGSPVQQLADLMNQYGLEEAELTLEGVRVKFSKKKPQAAVMSVPVENPGAAEVILEWEDDEDEDQAPSGPAGTPIATPMTGIFYASSSPDSPPFVKVGDSVSAGDVVALIEAMKVFNEITAPQDGIVTAVIAKAGQVVTEGDPLLFIN